MEIPKIKRRNQFRTITVSAFPVPGVLPSQVLTPLLPRLRTSRSACLPAISWRFGGEYEEQVKGFKQLVL